MKQTRRQFLVYLGIGTYAALRHGSAVAAVSPKKRKGTPSLFSPIKPSTEDRLVLPPGFHADIVAKWGDPLGTKGPKGDEHFGFDNDFLAFFPLDALTTNKNTSEGLLWVNHESVNPLFVSRFSGSATKTREQITTEALAVGGSIIHVKREGKTWKHLPGGKHTRRITALYPEIEMTGPFSNPLKTARGSLGNCSGGKTLWNTVLTCEENYTNFNGPYRWSSYPDTKIDESQYGWITEIDPFGELPPQKHTCLGRFAHENAAMTLGKTGRLVVYMGDDAEDQCFFKFVSEGKFDPKASRAEKRKLLTSGTLYAADFENGKWIALDLARSNELREAGYKSQGEVMLDARRAAHLAKATPVDRPEDCEVHPKDASVYIAFTNNKNRGNLFGHLTRLIEHGDDAESEKFRYEIFLAGGADSGLAAPDNLAFDRHANLWVACDMTNSGPNRGEYAPFGNNGLFMVPTGGKLAGEAFQFASGPVHCELTGPWFTEKGDTLFLSVQHPGELSPSLESPTSHWPNGGKEIPRPSVVAITGF